MQAGGEIPAGMGLIMLIKLTEYDKAMCTLFAREAVRAHTHQEIEFGNRARAARNPERMYEDIFTGKLAEMAVAHHLYRAHGIKIATNFEQIPQGDCDNEDLTVNGWRLDIKCTRKGRWLLFERGKAEYRRRSQTAPDLVIACKVQGEDSVDIVGGISYKHLTNPDGRRVRFFRKGEALPGTGTALKADNYAVPFDRLGNPATIFDFTAKHRKGERWQKNSTA